MFAIIVNDDKDYSMSWTGNYAGFSCRIKGLYSTEELALQNAHFENYDIIEIPIDKEIDILLGGDISYHTDDY